jgi:Na+/H+ antiporter NhaC
LASIPYRFYIWAALLLVPVTAILGRDIGAMVGAEQRVQGDDASREVDDMQLDAARAASSSWYNAVLPIGVTLALVVYFIWTTGSQSACDAAAESAIASASALISDDSQMDVAIAGVKDAASTGNVTATKSAIGELAKSVESFSQLSAAEASRGLQPKLSVRDIVGAADSSLALQYGALAGLCLACLMPLLSRLLSVNELIAGAASGARVVLPAIAILWCASAMSRMTTDKSVEGVKSDTPYAFKDHRLYTADYLTQVLTGNDGSDSSEQGSIVSVKYLPTIVFVLAAVVAFCTGTSWGTMGILVPMVVQTSHAMLSQGGGVVPPNDPILLSSIGGVLAGAVFGDHCSPISDTTVLSSQSSGCDHLAHVWTQMPYALLAAGVSILLGTLPIGFGVSIWILLPLQLLALFGFMRFIGTKTN